MTFGNIKEAAPLIWTEIERARRIVINLHYQPDQDSVGSALALKHLLAAAGKSVTVISFSSPVPDFAAVLPAGETIVVSRWTEFNWSDFDLWLIVDTASPAMIAPEASFPAPIKTIVIDHHHSNSAFADLNLIAADRPATAQILFELIKIWIQPLTASIAACLAAGVYGDTGGFRYAQVNQSTFQMMAELVALVPDYPLLISQLEENQSPQTIRFFGLVLTKLELLFGNQVAISAVSAADLSAVGIEPVHTVNTGVSSLLRSIQGVSLTFLLVERNAGVVNISARAKTGSGADVAAVMKKFGGGGHQAAAGATVKGTLAAVKADLLAVLNSQLP